MLTLQKKVIALFMAQNKLEMSEFFFHPLCFFSQFMQKSVSKRLGCISAHGGEEAIRHHSFFKPVDWEKMERRQVKPPFRPKIVS